MGRRKSLLIGINYIGSQNQLEGCIDDVQNMRAFLISRGFPTDANSMVIMTDERRGPFYPDGHNVRTPKDIHPSAFVL
jgi:metacaspase-1